MGKQSCMIDIDGVLANSDDLFREIIYKRTGVDLATRDLLQHPMSECEDGIGNRVSQACFVGKILPEFHKRLSEIEPIIGADDALEELYTGGWDVHIVTARDLSTKSDTEYWLNRHCMSYDSLTFSTSKVQAGKYDFIVEDKHSTALAFAKAGTKAYLFDYVRNLDKETHENLKLVCGWDHIRDILAGVVG